MQDRVAESCLSPKAINSLVSDKQRTVSTVGWKCVEKTTTQIPGHRAGTPHTHLFGGASVVGISSKQAFEGMGSC